LLVVLQVARIVEPESGVHGVADHVAGIVDVALREWPAALDGDLLEHLADLAPEIFRLRVSQTPYAKAGPVHGSRCDGLAHGIVRLDPFLKFGGDRCVEGTEELGAGHPAETLRQRCRLAGTGAGFESGIALPTRGEVEERSLLG
jgi:hypothetical protein